MGCFIDRALLGIGLPRNVSNLDDCPYPECEGIIGFEEAETRGGVVVACSENSDHWRLPTLSEEAEAKKNIFRR